MISKVSFLLKSYYYYPSHITTPTPLEFSFNLMVILTSKGKINGLKDRDKGQIGTSAIHGTRF